ncbi:alpha/beta fold hydrolase [Psychrobacter sp. NPDC078370]|mgnify:FL=1|uniref:Putative hydrolase n=1 Tax=Psychrobacter nivimaris TaxID=281738 RepID=A0A6N7C1Z8_9GAMM|nr:MULTISPECIES: alpha/beta hydrolase [Psychrobacter]KAF0569311.1 putative hydrolase [Psychrobacter nivimaris]PLT23097.1 alpha/beta hydrolase [Psychrobacter sp. MES7-P7E]
MEAFTNRINLGGKQARYYDLSQFNQPLDFSSTPRAPAHFYSGNSFTVGTYTPLLSKLATEFDISSLALRGYWYDKPQSRRLTREQDADMLIEFLEKTQNKPVIGIGHSQGATATAMAAAKRPELFSQLYLIEPVTFTKHQATLYNLLPRSVLLSREPFKSTLTKQSTWPSTHSYYESLRAQRAYKRISDEHLQVFAEQSLSKNTDGSYTLMFAPEQELANYFGAPHIDAALKKLRCPYTLITGKPTLFINDKVRKQWKKFVPDSSLISLSDYGHLLPMEAPELCAQIINEHYQSSK